MRIRNDARVEVVQCHLLGYLGLDDRRAMLGLDKTKK